MSHFTLLPWNWYFIPASHPLHISWSCYPLIPKIRGIYKIIQWKCPSVPFSDIPCYLKKFRYWFSEKLQTRAVFRNTKKQMRCGRHLLYFIIFSFPDVLNRDRTFCLFIPLGKTWRILFHPRLRVLSGLLNVLLNFCCYRD